MKSNTLLVMLLFITSAANAQFRIKNDGVVKKVVNPSSGDYGMQVVIKIDNSTYYAAYCHLSEIDVALNDIVKKGDIIGKTGITGNASNLTGDERHLHFECRTELSPGTGLGGRTDPNLIVVTKFYTQDDTKKANGDYTATQTNVGVKKVDIDETETLMNIDD